ncbi:MAG TPA: hypothetical protein VFZ43_05215 [Anaerolineales bacterium]
MKKPVQPVNDAYLAGYHIKDLVDGWFFRIREVSNGVYEVEGIDHWGHKVSRTGTENELDEILKACAEDARQIQANLNKE